jgi:hypothetical protein
VSDTLRLHASWMDGLDGILGRCASSELLQIGVLLPMCSYTSGNPLYFGRDKCWLWMRDT